MVECAGLEIRYTVFAVSRVRIPLSPPDAQYSCAFSAHFHFYPPIYPPLNFGRVGLLVVKMKNKSLLLIALIFSLFSDVQAQTYSSDYDKSRQESIAREALEEARKAREEAAATRREANEYRQRLESQRRQDQINDESRSLWERNQKSMNESWRRP